MNKSDNKNYCLEELSFKQVIICSQKFRIFIRHFKSKISRV